MEYSPLFVTLMGIGTVFFGLICIIFLTMAMGAVLKGKEKTPAVAAAAPAAAAPAPKPQKITTVRRYDLCSVKRLQSKEDIDQYIEGIRGKVRFISS